MPLASDLLNRDRPGPNLEPVRVVYSYAVPHRKGAKDGFVWCTYCAKPTHFDGGVLEFADGTRRTVGWCCCNTQGIDLAALRAESKRLHRRQIRLNQFDSFRAVLPEVLQELRDLRRSHALTAFEQLREECFSKLHPLFLTLQAAVFHDDGELRWSERASDYSGTALLREDGRDNEGGRAKGQRTVELTRSHKIAGAEFVDPRLDPRRALSDAIARLESAATFYSRTDTEMLSADEFRKWGAEIGRAVAALEIVEKTTSAPERFFDAANLAAVAEARNLCIARGRYEASGRSLIYVPQDRDTVEAALSLSYAPVRVRSLRRLRNQLGRK
jgi:hypothetical protein